MKVELANTDNQVITLEVPPTSASLPSFFVFSLHKAGSVLQDKVIEDICRALAVPSISVPKSAFGQGVKDNFSPEAFEGIFNPSGYCYYGFRYLPFYLDGIALNQYKKLLLIRDPRDMLVSYYFSVKKSHPIPGGDVGKNLLEQRQALQNVDIDKFVLERAAQFSGTFARYDQIDDENLALFRYEDIVFEKERWIKSILAFLEVELDEATIAEIVKKHDIFPDQENSSSHIRKVSPGDHKEKLQPETIEQLNEILLPILQQHRYL